ncbi:hypothetical protein BGX29_008947 [Mortierella sp. GBA35]|nr:hypothetical protein BGX23_009091 [Mortierella sp. AD031]KAF9095626.1 hypothetical protein BGX29_008947 [Mortierella sp. GBA35]KAG0207213.1 hypothetical protein BGX33_006947 [Mortierella sp. NVP41]
MSFGLVLVGLAATFYFTAYSMFIRMITQRLGDSIQNPLQLWEALNTIGLLPIRTRAWIFSTIVGLANPYSSTIDFRITELRKGKACGVMKQSKINSNPFKRVHEAALITFGETVGSLAFLTLLNHTTDIAVLTNISADYVKVSRGLLTASSVIPPIKDMDATELVTHVLIKNASFETVSQLTLTWKIDLQGRSTMTTIPTKC